MRHEENRINDECHFFWPGCVMGPFTEMKRSTSGQGEWEGGEAKSQEFHCGNVKFEMPGRYPRRDVK